MKRIALLFAVFWTTTLTAATLTVTQYAESLQRIHTSIANNDVAAAKAEATSLAGSEIRSPHGTFHADESLLAAVQQARPNDRPLLTRIELTLAELKQAGSAPPPDPKLLQRVAAEQDVPELAAGGDLTPPPAPEMPLIERVLRSIGEMFRWIWQKLLDFWDWLGDLFPDQRQEPGATSGMRWIVMAVVALIVIGILYLAFEVIRRARRNDAGTLLASAPLRSSRDDDPLSRGATEWERYAVQLTAEGRFREAIRAWYHAVLVTCYGAGVLHFRKGRTNWEYIASLPPSTSWRPELMSLTRRFEHEWYGALESDEETLEECSERAKRILDAVHADSEERGAA